MDRLGMSSMGSTTNLIQNKHSIYSMSTSALIPQEFFSMARSNFSEGKQKDMTFVLFNFSGLTGLNSNDENVFVNNCLTIVGPIISKHHGIFHKFFDEYFLVMFDPKYTINAIECSYECVDSIRKNALECSKSNSYASGVDRNYLLMENINLVVHTCPCKVGPVHFNEKHSDFLVMSPQKDVLRRMASLGRLYDIPIILTSAAVQKSEVLTKNVNQAMIIGPFGKFFLSNSPYELFQLYDTNWDVFLYAPDRKKDFKTSLEMFQQRKFIAAMNIFSKLHRMNDNDKLSLLYVKVCRMYQQSELPPQWDGVVMVDKDSEPYPMGKKQKGYYIQAGISASFHLGDDQFLSHGKDKEEEIRLLTESLNQKAAMIKDMKEILSVKENELSKLHEITELLMKEKKQLSLQLKQSNEKKAIDKTAKKQQQTQQGTTQQQNGEVIPHGVPTTNEVTDSGCFAGLFSRFGSSSNDKKPKRNPRPGHHHHQGGLSHASSSQSNGKKKFIGNKVTPVNH